MQHKLTDGLTDIYITSNTGERDTDWSSEAWLLTISVSWKTRVSLVSSGWVLEGVVGKVGKAEQKENPNVKLSSRLATDRLGEDWLGPTCVSTVC